MANIMDAFAKNNQQLEDELANFKNTVEDFLEELDGYVTMPAGREHPLRPVLPSWSGDIEEDLVIHYK